VPPRATHQFQPIYNDGVHVSNRHTSANNHALYLASNIGLCTVAHAHVHAHSTPTTTKSFNAPHPLST
jgi:hypothetical protein